MSKKFTRNTPVLEVIEYGKQLLKDVGYVPQAYRCRGADEAMTEVRATDETMTVGQFATLAREREDWAILCAFCLIVPEFEAQLTKGLQRSFLGCVGYHFSTASVIAEIYGDSLPNDPDCQRIRDNAAPELQAQYINAKEITARRRAFKWQ